MSAGGFTAVSQDAAGAGARDETLAGPVLSGSSGETWSAFASALSEEAFCGAWLALQCLLVSRTRAGLLLLRSGETRAYVPAAIWPDAGQDVTHLAPVAEAALTERRGAVARPEAEGKVRAGSMYVAYPVESDGELEGAVVLDLAARPENELEAAFRQLLWGTGWLVALLRRQRLVREGHVLARASTALVLVQAAQEHAELDAAAIAAVNELANAAQADRVSLGVVRKDALRLRAISRTAWFDRKSQLSELIENAMEEALDQQASIVFPPAEGVKGKVSVAQRDLAIHAGAAAVLSVLMRSGGRP